MFNRKILAIVLSMLCLTACSGGNDVQQTSVSETTTAVTTSAETTANVVTEAVTTTEITTEETVEETTETTETTEDSWRNPEDGLVFFVQPSICQRDEASRVDDWECRDTEVLRDFHYDGEWQYAKELIFVFSNYTDEPVTIDSINIVNDAEDKLVSFTDGSLFLDINLTVQPMHKTDYILRAEDFDYSACESGIYNAVANVGLEGYGRKFFINNCELYTESYTSQSFYSYDEESRQRVPSVFNVYAPTFLTEEQQKIFAQADGVMSDWFWTSQSMPEEYSSTHTADDFMAMLYEVFTEKYANELAAEYIDENGNLQSVGDRGSNIMYHDHYFVPVSADENKVEFKAVVIFAHIDNPYNLGFDDDFYYVMLNTENGWRVDRFDVWN